ncbi:MAG: hypothetical protein ABIV50_08415, partial [Opitutus sp.]
MRRLAVILGLVALAVAAVVLSLPWWLGTLVASAGPRFGVTVGDYRRIGYTRFAIDSLVVRRDPVVVKVNHAEADTPVVWLWRHWTSTPGQVIAGEWSTEVQSSEKKGEAAPADRGWTHVQQLLHKIANHLADWVPNVEAGRGFVTWPGSRLDFSSAQWKDRSISSPAVSYRALHGAVAVRFGTDRVIEGTATIMDGDGTVTVRSEETKVTGRATWWSQPAVFSAEFDERGWLPSHAIVNTEKWELAGSRVKLGSTYSAVRGSGKVEWREGQLTTSVSVQGQPIETTPAPPLSIEVKGRGASDTFVAEQLDVSMPGITAHLSAPVAIDRFGNLRSEPSTFVFDADLARQPWFPGKGVLKGRGEISANAEGRALVDFSMVGDNAEVTRIALSHLEVKGQLEWPRLTIAEVTLRTPDGGEATVSGGLDFTKKELLNSTARGRFSRQLLAGWLPAYPEFGLAEFTAKANGPWAKPVHEGQAHVEKFRFERTQPMTVDATWNGEGIDLDGFTGRLAVDDNVVAVRGSAGRLLLTLNELTLANGKEKRLALTRPADLRWGPHWQLAEVDLSGPAAVVSTSFTSGENGQFRLRADRFDPEWLRPFLIFPATKWRVETLNTDAHWANGPAEYTATAAVTVELGNDRSAQLSVELTGSNHGV